MNQKPGRPKTLKTVEELTFTSYREDITHFKSGLQDALEDEEYSGDKDTIKKFFSLPVSHLNIFIMYLIKNIPIFKLAELLECSRKDILHIITITKNALRRK